ncbi:hypothetical protein QJQ45_022141 [Haematococcus lacustris]|nr:hypothetical protein QJQ45_022141 [Haematococcus lacustris]
MRSFHVNMQSPAPANSDGIALFANRRPDWQLPDLNVELVLSQDLQPAQLSQRSSCPKCLDHCPSFDPAMAVVLFPSDDAVEVQALQPLSLDRVFIIDSKWKKAKELNQHPALRGVRRVRLTHHRSSFWRFHTSGVADDGVCTIECMLLFLRALLQHGKIGSTATPGPEQDVHNGRSSSTPFLFPEAVPQPAPTSIASQPQPDATRGPQAAPQAQPQLTPQPAPQPALQPAPASQHQPEVEGVVQPASHPATQAQPQAQPRAQPLAPPSPDLHAYDDLMWFFAQQHRHIQQQAVLKLQQRKDRKRKVSHQGLRAIPAPRSSHAHTENPVAGQLCIFSSSSSLRSLDLGDALPHDAGSGCSGTLFPQQGRSPDYVVNNVRGPVLRRASRSAMMDHSPTVADASLPRRGVSRKCSFMLPAPTPRQSGGCSGRVSDSALTTEIVATALADSAAMCDSGGSSFRRKSVEQSAPTFPLRSARNRCSTEIDLVIARSGNSSCSGSLPPITNMQASSSPLLHRLACLHSTSFTAGKTASLSGAAAPSHDDRQQQQQQQQHLSHLCPTAAPECHSGSGLARRAIPLRTRSFSRVPSMLQQDAVCHQAIPSSGSTHTLNMGTALVAWLQKPSLHQCSLGSEEGQEAVLPEEQGVAAGGVRKCS